MTTHSTAARAPRARPARRPVPAWAAAWSGAVMGLGFTACMVCAASGWVLGVLIGALIFAVGMKLTGRKASKHIDLGPVKYE